MCQGRLGSAQSRPGGEGLGAPSPSGTRSAECRRVVSPSPLLSALRLAAFVPGASIKQTHRLRVSEERTVLTGHLIPPLLPVPLTAQAGLGRASRPRPPHSWDDEPRGHGASGRQGRPSCPGRLPRSRLEPDTAGRKGSLLTADAWQLHGLPRPGRPGGTRPPHGRGSQGRGRPGSPRPHVTGRTSQRVLAGRPGRGSLTRPGERSSAAGRTGCWAEPCTGPRRRVGLGERPGLPRGVWGARLALSTSPTCALGPRTTAATGAPPRGAQEHVRDRWGGEGCVTHCAVSARLGTLAHRPGALVCSVCV